MAENDPQENPVFTYRAGFRKAADRAQWLLIAAGVMLLCAGVVLYVLGLWPLHADIMLLLGVLLAGGGVMWGFSWRQQIRTEFTQKFGPKNERDGL